MTTEVLERPARESAGEMTAHDAGLTKAITRVTLHAERRGLFRVTDANGQTLLTGSRDPEHEVCRLLKSKGITGTLETWWPNSPHAAMRLDIDRGAGLTVSEGRTTGLCVVKWRPIDPDTLRKVHEGRVKSDTVDSA